jgi:hypothetical protein
MDSKVQHEERINKKTGEHRDRKCNEDIREELGISDV